MMPSSQKNRKSKPRTQIFRNVRGLNVKDGISTGPGERGFDVKKIKVDGKHVAEADIVDLDFNNEANMVHSFPGATYVEFKRKQRCKVDDIEGATVFSCIPQKDSIKTNKKKAKKKAIITARGK